ncbi:MAG: alpha-hydroxy-acid oxidizing protein [Clostridiales bacterium]|nr:alpha-hydroxy-acid oxidizing protein [Clostridiales bacterium]
MQDKHRPPMPEQKPADYSEDRYFGGPNSPKRADGLQFGYVPYSLISEHNDSNKITRECYDSYMIEYRYLNSWEADTHITLWNKTFDTPIMVGGLSAIAPLLHPNGMVELAKGAAAMNTPALFGYISNAEVDELVATGADVIRIVKMQRDNEAVLADIRHDEECGCFAVAMDIDHGIAPDGTLYHPTPDYGQLCPKTTEEMAMFVQSTRLPFIAKGVLSVQDAKVCAEAGVAAILLSHHKGEIVDAVPPLYVLPEIKAAVGDKMKIFVDCGITSGIDAYKALALGADAVCVARNLVKPYMKEGAPGVENRLRELNAELRGIMSRTCTLDTAHFDPTTLRKKDW